MNEEEDIFKVKTMKTLNNQTAAYWTERAKASDWFDNLLDDVEHNYDQYPVQSVLNDYGVFKEMANVLIKFKEFCDKDE